MITLGQIKTFSKQIVVNPIEGISSARNYLNDPLFVFQMGKVGSRSVVATLDPWYQVHHSHSAEHFSRRCKIAGVEIGSKKKGRNVNVVTIVREPISREISSFFQNLSRKGHFYYVGEEKYVKKLTVEALQKIFLSKFYSDGKYTTQEWFQTEFISATGVDLLASELNNNAGWNVVVENNLQILILRFEDISSGFIDPLNNILANRRKAPAKITSLKRSNISNDKWYGAKQVEFLSKINFPKEVLEDIYDSAYCNKFYLEKEILQFRHRWESLPQT